MVALHGVGGRSPVVTSFFFLPSRCLIRHSHEPSYRGGPHQLRHRRSRCRAESTRVTQQTRDLNPHRLSSTGIIFHTTFLSVRQSVTDWFLNVLMHRWWVFGLTSVLCLTQLAQIPHRSHFLAQFVTSSAFFITTSPSISEIPKAANKALNLVLDIWGEIVHTRIPTASGDFPAQSKPCRTKRHMTRSSTRTVRFCSTSFCASHF